MPLVAAEPVPFLDLKAQYRSIGPALQSAVSQVLESGQYVLGPCVERFETAFAGYCGAGHAIGVNSGTSALHLALLAAGIGAGDEVITVPMTFVATVAAILAAGATPRFIDVTADAWTMDASQLEAAITPRTKAIIPVHLHGRLADMPAILAIARRHQLIVIEDAAQAHGAAAHGRRAGTFGDIGCFSFYPGKNLGACGEGGAVVTDRDDFAARVRSLRDWGQAERYRHVLRGFNYRMDAIQGAVLGVKLDRLEAWIAARRAIAAAYDAGLADVDAERPAAAGDDHVWHVYAVRVRQRERVRGALTALGIATGMHYPIPVHLQPAYVDLGYRAGDFPQSEAMAAETLSLPLFPEMSEAQVHRVCAAMAQSCGQGVRDVDAA
ncbi:MAG: DegT/DnrJ/EryC1/StrS family aminotransferase [Rhodospirillales bacterium]|nr:DegT/DnrJ/EryC1/StrS family aminotransferase [Rhodospirillales bacterium]